MRSFLKFSIAAAVVGTFLFSGVGPVSAMEVGKNDNGSLGIGGFLIGSFGLYTPGGVFAPEDAPAGYTGMAESSLTTTYTSADNTVVGNITWRTRSGGGAFGPRQADNSYIPQAQLTWMPMENFRLDIGKIGYRSWQERTCHWDNFRTYRPIPGCWGEYMWYPESRNGLDLTFVMPGDMNIEAGVFLTDAVTTNDADGEADAHASWAGSVSTGAAGEGNPHAQSMIAHVRVATADWHVIAIYGSENLEVATADAWGDSEKSANTGMFLNAKFNYMADSWAKGSFGSTTFDKFNGFGVIAEETQNVMVVSVNQSVGGPHAVYFEYASTTNYTGIKDNDESWLRVGVKRAITPGGRVSLDYESNSTDNGTDTFTDTYVGVTFFQAF